MNYTLVASESVCVMGQLTGQSCGSSVIHDIGNQPCQRGKFWLISTLLSTRHGFLKLLTGDSSMYKIKSGHMISLSASHFSDHCLKV